MLEGVTRSLLRARHWQIFVVTMGAMVLGQLAVVSSFPASPASPEDFQSTVRLLGIVTVVFMILFMSWFWAMGSFLNPLAPPYQRPRIGMFRFALIYPGLYVGVFLAVFALRSGLPALLVPFHLFAVFCMFYNVYFVSKTLVLAETGKRVSFYDYAGSFFLLWFFPVGVWIIQPRINRLFMARPPGSESI